MCTVTAVCDYKGRRQRRSELFVIAETCWGDYAARYMAFWVGSWTAARWEFCSLSQLWTAVWYWEGPSTALVPLGICTWFIQAWFSFLSAVGKHKKCGGVKEQDKVSYSYIVSSCFQCCMKMEDQFSWSNVILFFFALWTSQCFADTVFTFFLACRKH